VFLPTDSAEDPKINVVSRYLREETINVMASCSEVPVVWSREEQSGCDIVIYSSGYSYQPRLVRNNPHAFRVLYLSEPLSVYPRHFMRGFWRPFDALLTWNDYLVDADLRIQKAPVVSYDYPYTVGHGLNVDLSSDLPDPGERRKALCQIVGDKYSPIIGQLYSLRR
jgi:hypothetical protein